MMPFSVCMSVYKNDKSDYLDKALKSILVNQTLKPDEVVLVIDGPISEELYDTINKYKKEFRSIMNIIPLLENKGLGNALCIAVNNAKYEIIARMDSDDIACIDRFEKQINFFQTNNIDVLGGQITEFVDNETNIIGERQVPLLHLDIVSYMKRRCPFNHMVVMFKKKSVLSVNNYKDWHYNEDYYLWIRMYLANYTFANIPDVLCNVRVGNDMYKRRGGLKYFKSEVGIQNYMLNKHVITLFLYCYNVLVRLIVQVLMPNSIRGFMFKKMFRK